jgi:hypothetical protein
MQRWYDINKIILQQSSSNYWGNIMSLKIAAIPKSEQKYPTD